MHVHARDQVCVDPHAQARTKERERKHAGYTDSRPVNCWQGGGNKVTGNKIIEKVTGNKVTGNKIIEKVTGNKGIGKKSHEKSHKKES